MAAVWDRRLETAPSRAPQRVGAFVTIALHAAAVVLLLSHEPTRTALMEAAPIMVELITPPRPERIQPPRAQPAPVVKPVPAVQPKPLPRPIDSPLITAEPEAPSPVIAPPPPPPAPVIAAPAPPPTPAPPAPAPVIQAATPVVPITPPLFNAAYLDNPFPPYPPQSQRMREQGRVILRVLVNTAGRADQVQLRTSSGSRRLDESALETVRKWKFVPARRGDQPIADWVLIPISFEWKP